MNNGSKKVFSCNLAVILLLHTAFLGAMESDRKPRSPDEYILNINREYIDKSLLELALVLRDTIPEVLVFKILRLCLLDNIQKKLLEKNNKDWASAMAIYAPCPESLYTFYRGGYVPPMYQSALKNNLYQHAQCERPV